MAREPTVFVIDDDAAMRTSLRRMIESADLPVVTYASAPEFLGDYDPDHPGCLVLDVRMPGMSGLELQELLLGRGWTIPVIIVSGHGDVPMAVRAVKRGALQFLEKPFRGHVLIELIREAFTLDDSRRRSEARRRELAERLGRLTRREQEVMELLARGLSVKEIARALGVSPKTVQVHRTHVLEKLEVGSVVELVEFTRSAER